LLKRYDQTLGAKLLEQIEDLAFANLRLHLVSGNQRPTEFANASRRCKQVPDMRCDPVHPVTGATLDAESYNLFIDWRLKEAVLTCNDGRRNLEG
jgi:hypothetical protein